MKRAIDRLETEMPLYEHVFISRQDLSNTQAEGLVEHFGIVLKDNAVSYTHLTLPTIYSV